jgi:hypothetical protein
MNFVQGHMRKFVESQGQNNLNPSMRVKKDISPATVIQTNSKEESTLTPQERARLRKAERAEKEFQMLTQAAKDARIT